MSKIDMVASVMAIENNGFQMGRLIIALAKLPNSLFLFRTVYETDLKNECF